MDSATRIWRNEEVGLLKQEWGKVFENKKVLDLGCGEGEIAREVFFNKGVSFVNLIKGLDNDEGMVEKAKQSGVYGKVILGDAGKMPVEDGSVDLVFSNSVLEHIKGIEQVLREVRRVLKPGGRLIATMPSHKLVEYIGWGKVYGAIFNRKYEHYHLYPREKWEKLLEKAGLDLVDSYYYLDRETVRRWHKCLWLNKLGQKLKHLDGKVELERLGEGGALAIKAIKI